MIFTEIRSRSVLTKLAVSDAHVALQQVVHLLNGLLLKSRRLKKKNNMHS